MIKKENKLPIEGNVLNLFKTIHKNPKIYNTVYGEILKALPCYQYSHKNACCYHCFSWHCRS